MPNRKFKGYPTSHTESRQVNFFLIFLLLKDITHEIFGLFNELINRCYISPFFASGPPKVFIIKCIYINGTFLSKTHRKVGRTVSMSIETRKIKEYSFAWLYFVLVMIVMKLLSFVIPFSMMGIIFLINNIVSFLLLYEQHFLYPICPIFKLNVLKDSLMFLIVCRHSLLHQFIL